MSDIAVKNATQKQQPFTIIELRLPGRNTIEDLNEILGADLQECVPRVNVWNPTNDLYY